MVLDEVGGRWVAVSATQGSCMNSQAEFWEVMSLQLRPDGTLDGNFVVRSTASCAADQQVQFTRVGDLKPDASVADPREQPPRVPSPAQGLHGNYQETDTYAVGGRNAEVNFDIATYCLRTGDRCLSYWQNPSDTKILIFTKNQWVLADTSQDAKCTNGSSAHGQITLNYPLPQPAQDPITLLAGRGHYTVTGECPFNSDFDSRVQRTGD
jgi:serine/threonine-protein kinase